MEQTNNNINLSRKKHIFNGRALLHKIFADFYCIPMSDDEKNKIANEFIKILIEYKKKENNIDIDRCMNRLKKIDFYVGNRSIIYFYYPIADSVKIPPTLEHSSVHELVHAMTGPLYLKIHYTNSKWERCFIEGMTDSTVRRIRSKPNEGQTVMVQHLRFDIPESNNDNLCYSHYVAIIRQMEMILGYNADSYIINGDNKFLDDFKKKYGSLFLIKMGYKLSRYKYDIVEIQNSLLTRCFETDLLNAKNEDDIKNLIIKLRNFSQLRGKTPKGEDKFYDEFYHNFYNKCLNFLNDKNIDSSFMKEYSEVPKDVKFYSRYSFPEMITKTIEFYNSLDSNKLYEYALISDFFEVESIDELNNYVTAEDYGQEDKPTICFSIYFKRNGNNDYSASLHYFNDFN